jgi:hypothetical protein
MSNIPLFADLPLYQNANADSTGIKSTFIIRKYPYSVISQDLSLNPKNRSIQQYLLVGPRGCGKSTLLGRIQVKIDSDEELSRQYLVVKPAEEQANICRLFDLLEEILHDLESRGMEVKWPGEEDDPYEYTEALFAAVHVLLEKYDKMLVLLLDNMDRVFETVEADLSSLRAHLLNFRDIKIIGTGTRLTKHFYSYSQPFYCFFRVMYLEALTSAEAKELLFHWGEQYHLPAVKEFVEKKPGQLEMIRTLTDGLPRTLQLFVNLLLANDQGTGYDYMERIMDAITPLYQERLNQLPPAQRKIVLQMAFCWEAVGAKELAEVTRMDSRVVSAQMSQLIDKAVVEKIETSTKNHLYRLTDRFFNLWLIFTQGSPREKRRVKDLIVFLENFYDARENNDPACRHLNAGSEGVTLLQLLNQEQTRAVMDRFEDQEGGPKLKEEFLPIFYATELQLRGDTRTSAKMPPEIRQVVEDILGASNNK